MYGARVVIRMIAVGIAAASLCSISALADRWDQNNRSDHSGQNSQSFRSSGSQSSHSASVGQSSARSFGSRQSQSNQAQATDTSSRSLGGGSRSNVFSGQTFGTPSLGRSSSDSSPSAFRAFGGQGGFRSSEGAASNHDNGGTSAFTGGWSQHTAAFSGADQRDSPHASGGTSSVSPPDASGFNWRTSTNNYSSTSRGFARSRAGDDSQGDGQQSRQFVRSQNSGAPVTSDKVRDFLQLRRDNTVTRGGAESNAAFNRQFNDRGSQSAFSRSTSNDFGLLQSRNQVGEAKKNGDRAWMKQFGNTQGTPGESSRNRKAGGSFVGTNDTSVGNANAKETNHLNKNFNQTLLDRSYHDWRNNAVGGDRRPGTDQRDWSGRWKSGERFIAANDIRDHWKNHSDHKNVPFSNDWWRHHDHHDGHHRDWDHFAKWQRPYYWWDWCSAPRLTNWCSFGWPSCYYWDYGPGEYLYCHDGVVYVNGVWFEPAPLFYERTLVLVQNVPVMTPVQAAQVEWLPLGVFAVARDGVADNNVLVQLAVTRDGIIGGTIFNRLTGATYDIQGTVDKQTQRAVWTYVDDTGARIIMETSIFNLTQPQATGLIHYGPDNIQVIELVRLESPNAGS